MASTGASRRPHVLVLGAGVIGLQTALELLEHGLDVTIVAKSWPGNKDPHYTSMRSGAQWRSNPAMEDKVQQDWDRQTFNHWSHLVKSVQPEELGIELKPAVFYWDNATPEAEHPEDFIWWSKLLAFKIISASAMPANFAAGIAYETFSVSPSLYLQYLCSTCVKLGAQRYTQDVLAIAKVCSEPRFAGVLGVVNCTGLGAGKLVQDTAVFPTRGQTIIVKGKAARIATRSGDAWEALVIPRPGANETLLGGCKIANDWSTDPDDRTTQIILDRCQPLAPELLNANGEFEVLSVQVGLRPSRHGGPRIEIESFDKDNGGEASPKFVCHNYGHHSAGFEGSVGVARTAVDLIMKWLETNSRTWKQL
ncbi:hypothetical protein IMSHALPRED_001456 [Imshaugia aleurites]|uniref:FAD dependent oxidoreductase domain-containing protein n=1 Tax=Imshaugia aleurites TaxID=172621 RepID=A0A8H3EYN3_9LECA|nr:hypothetical protein IMSHALPRED_001456 [Imshaugia aleurites]